ncbi:MAG: VOC family protein [Saprospiraceae bacterium]|nr:VOC family protein [Saprospiraceae bacterium]
MKRVTGIGGIFFKCQDPAQIRAWYAQHLGFQVDDYGTMFEWRQASAPETPCFTQWSPFKEDTTYFQPSEKDFMFNYRVENLEALLEVLRAEGVTIVGEMQTFEYGKFGWILDPEGNKIELWEPVDQPFQDLYGEDGATK